MWPIIQRRATGQLRLPGIQRVLTSCLGHCCEDGSPNLAEEEDSRRYFLRHSEGNLGSRKPAHHVLTKFEILREIHAVSDGVPPVYLHHHVGDRLSRPSVPGHQLHEDVQTAITSAKSVTHVNHSHSLIGRSLDDPLGHNERHADTPTHNNEPPNWQPSIPVPHSQAA